VLFPFLSVFLSFFLVINLKHFSQLITMASVMSLALRPAFGHNDVATEFLRFIAEHPMGVRVVKSFVRRAIRTLREFRKLDFDAGRLSLLVPSSEVVQHVRQRVESGQSSTHLLRWIEQSDHQLS
jgi:hypothetical protein